MLTTSHGIYILCAVELTSKNEAKPITGFTIVADVGSCQQPIGWFDQLNPEWNSTQCMQKQVTTLISVFGLYYYYLFLTLICSMHSFK